MIVHFYLNRRSGSKRLKIQIYLSGLPGKRRLVFSTMENIQVEHWDISKERAKRSYIYSSTLNSYLSNLAEELKNCYWDYQNKSEVFNIAQFKQEIGVVLGRNKIIDTAIETDVKSQDRSKIGRAHV